ncbi:predicted protein [Postia placenta Mad-698-R]|nr:predicted protein [Postia placenta Mad-698-R]
MCRSGDGVREIVVANARTGYTAATGDSAKGSGVGIREIPAAKAMGSTVECTIRSGTHSVTVDGSGSGVGVNDMMIYLLRVEIRDSWWLPGYLLRISAAILQAGCGSVEPKKPKAPDHSYI